MALLILLYVSFKDYLTRQGVDTMVYGLSIKLIAAGQGIPIWAAILAFKARAGAVIAQILLEPHAALLTCILLVEGTGITRTGYGPQNTIPVRT